MEILLSNIGKKFRTEWIFRGIDYHFKESKSYAITGHNGSGKSTLLRVITGMMPANEGKVIFQNQGIELGNDETYKRISFAAPYLELIEEFTLQEILDFHINFKPLIDGVKKDDFFELVYLTREKTKQLKQFSSGMKQRLKLGLSFFTESDVIFLDEPTTNLDETGIQWYIDQVSKLKKSKLVIISSNDKREYQFCDEILDVTAFK
ncbi:ABC transporter ATP-binding protein [Jiulongibacter sediminis]|uniref:ABC transporter ATP-binding protein n=1 Tax=Jiulongibacter sediminis TaxID=1605367 RepID=A0A0P7BX78_9BACT|nr:ATP-binding cassette domain-containing protein [Jiulongibacter sediminis]KPM49526.1 ABC transporter ATP-binding protein [Jiulongibacter sediminis]TBX26569.1 ABC transporter ATP-binding protein [Jiulongibacter sediminis]